MGILICGLNGAGKSTLGRILADRMGFEFIDNEVDGIICKLEELPAAICSMAFDKDKYHTILMNSNKRGSGNKESLDSFINLVELSLREFHQ